MGDGGGTLPRMTVTPTLSPRQLQALELTADGLTQTSVARAMFISPSTVKSTLTEVYRVLGADSPAHAVRIAMRAGILK